MLELKAKYIKGSREHMGVISKKKKKRKEKGNNSNRRANNCKNEA